MQWFQTKRLLEKASFVFGSLKPVAGGVPKQGHLSDGSTPKRAFRFSITNLKPVAKRFPAGSAITQPKRNSDSSRALNPTAAVTKTLFIFDTLKPVSRIPSTGTSVSVFIQGASGNRKERWEPYGSTTQRGGRQTAQKARHFQGTLPEQNADSDVFACHPFLL